MNWKELVMDAYKEARPYITYVKWFKTLLDQLLKNAKSINDIIEELEKSLEKYDTGKQTDIKIFLMFLEKVRKGSR